LLLKRTSLIVQFDLVSRWVKENETLLTASLFPTSFVRARTFTGFIVLGANVAFALLHSTRLLQCHLAVSLVASGELLRLRRIAFLLFTFRVAARTAQAQVGGRFLHRYVYALYFQVVGDVDADVNITYRSSHAFAILLLLDNVLIRFKLLWTVYVIARTFKRNRSAGLLWARRARLEASVGCVVVLVPGVQVVVVARVAAATNHTKYRRQNATTVFRGIALHCLHLLRYTFFPLDFEQFHPLDAFLCFLNFSFRFCRRHSAVVIFVRFVRLIPFIVDFLFQDGNTGLDRCLVGVSISGAVVRALVRPRRSTRGAGFSVSIRICARASGTPAKARRARGRCPVRRGKPREQRPALLTVLIQCDSLQFFARNFGLLSTTKPSLFFETFRLCFCLVESCPSFVS